MCNHVIRYALDALGKELRDGIDKESDYTVQIKTNQIRLHWCHTRQVLLFFTAFKIFRGGGGLASHRSPFNLLSSEML